MGHRVRLYPDGTETDENGSYTFEFKDSTEWNGDGLWFLLWLK